MPSSHLILCHPLLLLPPIPPSIRVFSSESTLRIRWPKYWSFNFSVIPSKEIPGLISFRMDWLDLLAVQGTLKSLLQHHSSKASILRRSAFFTVQLSHPYMTIGKTIALTRWTFVGKVMSLLLNMLSRLVITSLLRSKRLFVTASYSLLLFVIPIFVVYSIHIKNISISGENCNLKGYLHPVFTAALFITARTWKQPKCPSMDEWIKMWYMCIYIYINNWILLSHKKNEMTPFAATCINLEIITLSEVTKDKYHTISLKCGV